MKLDPVDRNNDLSITHGKPTITFKWLLLKLSIFVVTICNFVSLILLTYFQALP